MARVLTFSGSGKLLTWSEPTALSAQVSSHLLQQGWGVSNVKIYNTPNTSQIAASVAIPLLATIPSWNYAISLDINAPDDENPERILQALRINLSNWFSDLTLKVSYDSANPVGSFLTQYGLYLGIGFAALVIIPRLLQSGSGYIPRSVSIRR